MRLTAIWRRVNEDEVLDDGGSQHATRRCDTEPVEDDDNKSTTTNAGVEPLQRFACTSVCLSRRVT